MFHGEILMIYMTEYFVKDKVVRPFLLPDWILGYFLCVDVLFTWHIP